MILKAQEARALLGRELIDHHCLSQRQLGDMPWEAERSLAALRGQHCLVRKVSRALFGARALLWEFLLFVAL